MPICRDADQPDLYYQMNGHGCPLLLIAPPGMGHVTFHYQKELRDICTVITFDIRGDGRSDSSDPSFTMNELVDDVRRVLDTNQIDRAVICGYSNGGCIAQEFALKYPQKTIGLMLIGGYYAVNSFLLQKEYQIGIWIAQRKWMKWLSIGLAKNHFRDHQVATEMIEEMKQTDPVSLARQYEIGLHYSCENRLSQLQMPLLLLYGSRDFYIHAYQHRYRKQVEDVEIAYIGKSKHQVPTKHAHVCNAIIREWLKRKRLVSSDD
ncbi:hydrolase [Gracilibacillus halophilus YIM-C55.5]|uniref:Hydrolase n=1 Tax=Gracilibacillus halophilus YIM-C55.5 TaxID=1308866 RepID=N4WZN8_9BACI|nr:alpha/beta hydrolase [Gracilibacillus halophilus]ENH98466.1 hydrolase [Gracilibacillus halophilus YIM-C55.5]